MDRDLAKLAKEGDLGPLQAWLGEQKKRPSVNDLLWCALWTEDDACRRFLAGVASEKKIPPQKGWKWNDAIAAAILGDPAGIERAEQRGADFEQASVAGTALTTAIRLDHVDFVNALLEKGVDCKSPVKMARERKVSVFGGSIIMIDATPLGTALRYGTEEMAKAVMVHAAIRPLHLPDAVQGGNEALLRNVLRVLDISKELRFEPSLFWSVQYPHVLPILAEHGFDLSTLPTDTGTWGGPIWSWWAYHLHGGDTRLDCFEALFETGVCATAQGLADVLGANIRGIASPEMVALFVANGADLSEDVEWEGEGWDEKNDCQKVERGSVAEKLMREGDLAIIQFLHEKGAQIRPTRADPDLYNAEEKNAWLASLGLIKEVDAADFPWLDVPSVDEIRSFLATEHGLFGLKLGTPKSELPDSWDLEQAESGGRLWMGFDGEDGLEAISRKYDDLHSDACKAIEEALVAAFGKPAKKSRRRKMWNLPDGTVELREEVNDYYHRIHLQMAVD